MRQKRPHVDTVNNSHVSGRENFETAVIEAKPEPELDVVTKDGYNNDDLLSDDDELYTL